jgi:16S rRNA (guanine527-N7)-methyltransferase
VNKKEFIQEINKLGIQLTDEQLHQLDKYYQLLIEWNKVMNLTGITEEKEVYLKHFYDSLTIAKVIDLTKEKSLCDVGSGAGFPGMVLKIVFPNLKVTLVDSLNKRIKFLTEVANELNLKDIALVHARAEDFAKNNREKFDVVTARAVASINVLLEYCLPLTKVGKYFIALKGNISQEIILLNNSLTKIGGKLINSQEFLLPIENSNRSLLVITKENPTSKKYPRHPKDIKNNPL